MRGVVVSLALIGLVGCATAGVKIDPNEAAAFERGKSTYADVVRKFGPPTTESVLGNGSRMIFYSYVRSSARPESFIPIVGPLVGGADSQSQMVSFRFGADGVLIDSTRTSSQIGVGTGLLSGGAPATRTGQPITPP